MCGVLGHLAPVHQCARSVCCVACAVSWATGLLFAGAPALCVVWRVRCPGPLGSCSPLCPLGVLCCVCGVPGDLAPVHQCSCWVCCVACAVSSATWLLFTGVTARCVVLRVRCPVPLGSCSPLSPLGALLWMCSVLSHLAPVHGCARWLRCFVSAVSWATWLLFIGAPALCVVLDVRCTGPFGSCSPVCPLGVSCCVCGVLGHLALVHWCACSVHCFACTVSWATWLLFIGVLPRCVALHLGCPVPFGSCSPVCRLGVSSWATWLLFTGVRTPSVAMRVRCPGPLGSCSAVCPLGVLRCLCDVLGHLAAVHRCARSVLCC